MAHPVDCIFTDVFVVNLAAKKPKRDKHGTCVKRTKSSGKLKAGLLSTSKYDLPFTVIIVITVIVIALYE